MKQGQSKRTASQPTVPYRTRPSAIFGHHGQLDRSTGWAMSELKPTNWQFLGKILVGLLTVTCFIVMLPFRVVYHLIAWLGRMTALLLGFCLMVVGMACLAGPLFWFGIPLFIIGLVLTLRCLD